MIFLLGFCYVLMGVCVLILIWCGFGLARNERVYRFKMDTLRKVSDAAQADIANGMYDFGWRYKAYNSVDYHDMVVKMWRPLTIEEWYDNDDFIIPRDKNA